MLISSLHQHNRMVHKQNVKNHCLPDISRWTIQIYRNKNVCLSVCLSVCVCARACVRECVRARVRAYKCLCVCLCKLSLASLINLIFIVISGCLHVFPSKVYHVLIAKGSYKKWLKRCNVSGFS